MRWLLALFLFAAPAAQAAEWQTLGYAHAFTNDYIGDGHDRWQSGAYTFSALTGAGPALQERPGRLLEWRLRSQIVMPWIGAVERPYATALSAAVIAHQAAGPLALSYGVEATRMGPSTGLADGQIAFHERFGFAPPRGATSELPDQSHFGALVEAAWPLSLGEAVGGATLRPFAAGRTGVEERLRVGGDLVLGPALSGAMLVRDEVTGQLLPAYGTAPGLALTVGADIGTLADSAFLPPGGPAPAEVPWRARAGLHWRAESGAGLFYGLTWLSPEFEGQREGQLVGSLSLTLRF
ncbi:lipid A-modifier LpxR family protein [Pseudoroseicyclus sp. H15]